MKWPTKKTGRQTYGEEIANAISHGLMVFFGIFILVFFIIQTNKKSPSDVPIVLIFSISVILLYLASTLNHSLSFTKAHKFFQKSDHISIYVLIWGTFAPILLLLKGLQGPSLVSEIIPYLTKGRLIFVCQCLLVLLGIVGKIFWFEKWEHLHLTLFLLFGWSGLLFVKELFQPGNELFFLFIFLGGCFYSVGVYFFVKDYKKYFHFIWHLFVILGTTFHALGIFYMLNSLNK